MNNLQMESSNGATRAIAKLKRSQLRAFPSVELCMPKSWASLDNEPSHPKVEQLSNKIFERNEAIPTLLTFLRSLNGGGGGNFIFFHCPALCNRVVGMKIASKIHLSGRFLGQFSQLAQIAVAPWHKFWP